VRQTIPSAFRADGARALAGTVVLLLAALLATGVGVGAENPVPTARLIPAQPLGFPGLSDSNSPMVWTRVGARWQLFAFTSLEGIVTRHIGTTAARLRPLGEIAMPNHPGFSVWMEAIVPDEDGTWYGYYHHERPAEACGDMRRAVPRIGAARSRDLGATWEDLGVILEAPSDTLDCASTNQYFVGGVGDFSVALDARAQDLYIFFSQYGRALEEQGVAVARLAWADRDAPAGRAMIWLHDRTWLPASPVDGGDIPSYFYPAGAPIHAAADGWHDDALVDAFWGPAVHWNTYLQQYVMLLNHAQDASWAQEGIYVSFAKTLDDPLSWSAPQKVLDGGLWYPQVVGTEIGTGTDKVASQRARFYLGGISDYLIEFAKPR
jgi:hypothetical protein